MLLTPELDLEVPDALAGVWEDCREPGWDGYDSIPIDPATLKRATAVLHSLPTDLPAPSVGAEADGAITFEWYHSSSQTLSVSIHAGAALHYAALLGPNSLCGTEVFHGTLPARIANLIQEIVADA